MKPGEPVSMTVAEMSRQAHDNFVSDLKKRRARNLLHTIRYANLLADAVVDSMPNPRVACREGCSSCCETYVSISIPEAIAIASHVTTQDTGQKRGEILKRLRELAVARRGRAWNQILPSPCAFLVGFRCSIYDARPIPCRRYHALDSSAACDAYVRKGGGELGDVAPTTDNRRLDAVKAIAIELAEACRELKLESARVELSAAVLLVLEKPDTAERWLRGDRVFASAYEPARETRSLPVVDGTG
jgi:Fe-S-cluster containining protein